MFLFFKGETVFYPVGSKIGEIIVKDVQKLLNAVIKNVCSEMAYHIQETINRK